MPQREWFPNEEKGERFKGMKTERPGLMHEGGKQFRKISISPACTIIHWTVSGSTRSHLSGNNTPEIVHVTKRSSITHSEVAVKTCLTPSEQSIERQARAFKVNAHLFSPSSNENPIYPS